MFDKKKLNFWRLAFLFAGFTILTLFFLWSSPREPEAQMMAGSMGSMMKQMHVANVTIYDLLAKGEPEELSSMKEMMSHHQNQSQVIKGLNFLSTAIILLFIPFIFGGSIVLAIVWKK